MTWKVTSREEPARWLESTGGVDYTADDETTSHLIVEGYAFPLTPTGPFVEVTDASSLYAAALHLLPGATVTGDPPDLPTFKSVPGAIY